MTMYIAVNNMYSHIIQRFPPTPNFPMKRSLIRKFPRHASRVFRHSAGQEVFACSVRWIHRYLLLLDLNRDMKISAVSKIEMDLTRSDLSLGTLLYGSVLNDSFLIEDIVYDKGVGLSGMTFGAKLGFIQELLRVCSKLDSSIRFALPAFFENPTDDRF